jgi:putative aldouronate transport system substrate-binding protein
MPDYVAYPGVKADLPGDPSGVLDGYLGYPASPVTAVSGVPGDGTTVKAMVLTGDPLPPAMSKSTFWQALNKKLGVTLDCAEIPSGDYDAKLATTLAGGDLPDLMQFHHPLPQMPQLLAAECQDLTDFLGGSAVKQYPMLANLPSASWAGCAFGGKLYGIPIPRSKLGYVMFYRVDIFDSLGLPTPPSLSTFSDFESLCKELTDVRKNRWALADVSGTFSFVSQSLGVANNWKEDGGKLTNAIEQPQTKEAFSATLKLIKAGYGHPDSASANGDSIVSWFKGGQSPLLYGSITGWSIAPKGQPDFKDNVFLPPNYDSGTKANTWQGKPIFSFTGFKKADQKRIEMLLRVANFLAAPFGTSEYLFNFFGLAGTHYTVSDGAIATTDEYTTEVVPMNLGYIANPPLVIYKPGLSQVTRDEYAAQKPFLDMSVADPTVNLYSSTFVDKNASLQNTLTSAQNDILLGRKPVSSWDGVVKAWRSAGGDQMRGEYEEQLQGS